MEKINHIEKLIADLESGKITCRKILEETLQNIKQYDNVLDCYISLNDEKNLLEEADAADKRRKDGKALSKIDGLPVAIKDNITVQGLPTTCGSRILEGYNSPYEATAALALRKAGAIIVGKTNMDEFAMGSTSETSAYHKTRNPYDAQRVPGGSSGGSASAVAAGLAPFALGSDTGGSIRQPAAFCGVVGIKPTYGLVSRYGLVSYASSLDQIGTFAGDVYGAALLLNFIAGKDDKDSTSLYSFDGDYTENLNQPIAGKKIAYFKEFVGEGLRPELKEKFDESIETLKKLGATVEAVDFPATKYAIATYYFIATAEAAGNLERYDGVKYGFRSDKQQNYEEMLLSSRSYGFGKEVKKRIMLGNFVLSSGYYDAYYRKSQKLRTYIMKEMEKVFEKYDFVIAPTTPDIACKFGEGDSDPMKLYLSDITTVLANLAGTPALSVPCGMVDSMPVGLQIFGKPLDEAGILNAAYQFEQALKLNLTPDLSKLADVKPEEKTENQKQETVKRASTVYTKEFIQSISDGYMNRNTENNRTLCRDLESLVGEKITMSGCIYKINSLGGIEFYTLRDRTGMTQLVLEGDLARTKISPMSTVEVYGKVTKEERSPYKNIEIKVEKLTVLGTAAPELPFQISGDLNKLNLPTILDHRQLSLRNTEIADIFKIQAEIAGSFAEFLRQNEFIEVKTSKIGANETEGGTNVFEIKYFDRSAFLAQSPQFYKQMLVGTSFERVFEIGPVFRAEKHNTVRHLNEYTSLDFEMSYIKDEQDVIDVQERMIKFILKNIKDKYSDVLERLGVDMRIPDTIPRIHFIQALEIAESLGVKDMDGDLSPEGEKTVCRYIEEKTGSQFVYIVGYPVKKRPMYTMPDERLPGYTRSFDLLYKGLEITSGGQRIHDYEQLKANMIANGLNPAAYKSYLDAFKFGMPPHGGLGMGLERVTMRLLELNNIREATLFPRDIGRLEP